MFWPLKGSGDSPRRFSTLHSAAVISDLPAPLLVPSTMSGVGRDVLLTSFRLDAQDAALRCFVHDVTEILKACDDTCSGLWWTSQLFVI